MGAVDSRVTRSIGVGRAAMARVLPGLQKPPPGKDLAAGARFVPFALCGLGLGVVLLLFGFGLTLVLPPLSGSVQRRPRLRLPVHSHRGTKSVPLFLYTNTPVCFLRSNQNLSVQPKKTTRSHRFHHRKTNLPLIPDFYLPQLHSMSIVLYQHHVTHVALLCDSRTNPFVSHDQKTLLGN